MKKLLVVFMLFLGIIITGCSNNNQEVELLKQQNSILQQQLNLQEDKISNQLVENKINNPVDNKDRIFQKKKDCNNYTNEVNNLMIKEGGGEELQLFYSPKLDTCVYGRRTYFDRGEGLQPGSIYFLTDLLTKESLYYDRDQKRHPGWDAKIEELKGE